MVSAMNDDAPGIEITTPRAGLEPDVEARLKSEMAGCPDVAFAHLNDVTVEGHSSSPQLTLFVWIVPAAMGSLRGALNLVSEAVARALPEDRFLDVVILNSAPELLAPVEEAGCLLVERDGEERRRALDAAAG
jgi:hypothetical protein